MSWNRPSEDTAKTRGKAEHKNGHLKGLLAGALVVIGIVAAWWCLRPDDDGRETAGNAAPGKRQIGEAKPAPASRARPDSDKKPSEPEKPKELPPQRIGEVRNGYRLLPSGRLHRVYGEIVVNGDDDTLMGKVFKCSTDRKVMELLTLEPGEFILQDESTDYFQNFEEQFRESLKVEIVTNPDDTEYVKELKQAAREMREDLRKRMNAGEDLSALMTDTRKQLQELSLYREDLAKQVRGLIADGELDEKDQKDLVDAANTMLKERGCKLLSTPAFLVEKLKLENASSAEQEQ